MFEKVISRQHWQVKSTCEMFSDRKLVALEMASLARAPKETFLFNLLSAARFRQYMCFNYFHAWYFFMHLLSFADFLKKSTFQKIPGTLQSVNSLNSNQDQQSVVLIWV